MKSKNIPGMINFKPWHLPVRRVIRLMIFGVVILLAGNLYLISTDYIVAYSAVSEAKQSGGDSVAVSLKAELEDTQREKANSATVLEALSQAGTGVQLEKILKVSGEYKPYGISVFTIGSDTITGCGPSLETVTNYIKRLSDELGTEVDVRSILQLELPAVVNGFELRF